jgi:hypothetical protein
MNQQKTILKTARLPEKRIPKVNGQRKKGVLNSKRPTTAQVKKTRLLKEIFLI